LTVTSDSGYKASLEPKSVLAADALQLFPLVFDPFNNS
jgi:hypothetical protein